MFSVFKHSKSSVFFFATSKRQALVLFWKLFTTVVTFAINLTSVGLISTANIRRINVIVQISRLILSLSLMYISVSSWQSWQCWTLVTTATVLGLDQSPDNPNHAVSYSAAVAQISHQKSCHTVKQSEECTCQTGEKVLNSIYKLSSITFDLILV